MRMRFFLIRFFMHCQNLSELWCIFVNINHFNAITCKTDICHTDSITSIELSALFPNVHCCLMPAISLTLYLFTAMKKREQSKDSQIRCKGKAIILQLDAARKQLGTFRSKESKHKHIIHRNREQILFVIVDIASLISESDAWVDIYRCLKEAGIELPKRFCWRMEALDESDK